MSKTALVAVGGNSLIRAGEKGTIAEQLANTRRTAQALVELIQLGYRLVITHGNGPQVGAQLLRSERASDVVYSQTLDVCGAASQGEIGYLLAQSLRNEFAVAGLDMPVVSLVTQTVVSADDPAMQHPTKPIGPFYSRADAEEKRRALGWHIVEDAARGYRRVVPSPEPLEIVELDVIRSLVARDVLVVSHRWRRHSGGARGRPAAGRGSGHRQGPRFGAAGRSNWQSTCSPSPPTPISSTSITRSPTRPHSDVSDRVAAWRNIYRAGHFPPGNMGPKVESVLAFPAQRRQEAVITSFEHLCEAVAGAAGTHIVPRRRARPENWSNRIGGAGSPVDHANFAPLRRDCGKTRQDVPA